jgi:hypothetical protein
MGMEFEIGMYILRRKIFGFVDGNWSLYLDLIVSGKVWGYE